MPTSAGSLRVMREYLDALDSGRFNYRPGFGCGMCDFQGVALPAVGSVAVTLPAIRVLPNKKKNVSRTKLQRHRDSGRLSSRPSSAGHSDRRAMFLLTIVVLLATAFGLGSYSTEPTMTLLLAAHPSRRVLSALPAVGLACARSTAAG